MINLQYFMASAILSFNALCLVHFQKCLRCILLNEKMWQGWGFCLSLISPLIFTKTWRCCALMTCNLLSKTCFYVFLLFPLRVARKYPSIFKDHCSDGYHHNKVWKACCLHYCTALRLLFHSCKHITDETHLCVS